MNAKKLKPITNKLLWIFAVGQFGWSLLSGIVSNWMVYYYTGSPDAQNPNTGIFASGITQNPILFKLTLFGLVLAVGRIFDAITDPLIAGWSDRSNYKGGRRIPFMRAVAIPFALVTIGLFTIPQTANTVVNDALLFVLLLLFYLVMTIFCTPYNALIAELGDTQKHRINVSTFISFTFIAGQSISFMLPNVAGLLQGAVGQAGSVRLAVAIMATVACVAMLIPSLYIKERDYIDSKPSETRAFRSLLKTFSNGQFRRFVYSDVIYFFALTLFQTGLAFYETKLMEIEDTWTFVLTATMTFISVLLPGLPDHLDLRQGPVLGLHRGRLRIGADGDPGHPAAGLRGRCGRAQPPGDRRGPQRHVLRGAYLRLQDGPGPRDGGVHLDDRGGDGGKLPQHRGGGDGHLPDRRGALLPVQRKDDPRTH